MAKRMCTAALWLWAMAVCALLCATACDADGGGDGLPANVAGDRTPPASGGGALLYAAVPVPMLYAGRGKRFSLPTVTRHRLDAAATGVNGGGSHKRLLLTTGHGGRQWAKRFSIPTAVRYDLRKRFVLPNSVRDRLGHKRFAIPYNVRHEVLDKWTDND